MVILAQKWAELYMKNNPSAGIQVTGGGSGVGITALINGTTDICNASRPMKQSEIEKLKVRYNTLGVQIPCAKDGITIFLNEDNKIQELTLQQLSDIYKGKTKNWKELGGNDAEIRVYGRENSSGTYLYFKEHVLENADYYPTTQTLPGTAAVINAVSKDIRGIGYGGIAYAKNVKALKVKKDAATPGVEPTLDNVQKNIYPISRFLYWYVAGQPKDQLKQLTDWVYTAEGQSVINDVGYYPLPADFLAKLTNAGSKAKAPAKNSK
jgi:phosphate transport system substrate-binding protein